MTVYGTVFFSMNDVNRLKILQDVIDRRLTTCLTATRLEISDIHCRRLLELHCEHGPHSIVNRRRGQPSNRQLMPGLTERALCIIRERYADFGPTLAFEKLSEVHGLHLARERVRKLMTQAGLWNPRKLVTDMASVFRINNKQVNGGDGQTQFDRAMNEITSRYRTAVRFRGISTPEAANAFAEEFMADYNRRFAKPHHHDFDVYRPLEINENLETTFT